MGTWGYSVTANDTAQDLLTEYQAVFFYNDPETAFKKIDDYVRKNICDETDEEEWCSYFYSLADYMWKKGLLTDEIRDKAVQMIDSGFGMELWHLSGEKEAAKRTAALEKFKEKLLSPQPPRKKITISIYTEPVFEIGDIIAMQLQTAGKTYTKLASRDRPMTDEEFHALDGKFILIRKVRDIISYTSKIEPNVKDIYPVFQLFDGVYDEPPAEVKLSELKNAQFVEAEITPLFSTDGGSGRYKKRKCKVIANDKTGIEELEEARSTSVYLSVNKEWCNPDSELLSAMGRELSFKEASSDDDKILNSMAFGYQHYWHNNHPAFKGISKEEIERHDQKYFFDVLKKEFAAGKRFYLMYFGALVGFFSVTENKIENFAMNNSYRWCRPNCFFERKLFEYAVSKCNGTLHIAVYNLWNKDWIAALEEMGYIECGTGEEDIVIYSKTK